MSTKQAHRQKLGGSGAVPGTGKLPNAGNKEMNRLMKQVKRQGGRVLYGGGAHSGVKVWNKAGESILLTLTKSGSGRTIKNARAKLRRDLGFKL